MKQFNSQTKPILDNSFSAFIMGLTVGVVGALLLGTEEGRKLTQKAIQAIPEDLSQIFSQPNSSSTSPLQVTPSPDPDNRLDTHLPPPPPKPLKPLVKPSPTFFSS